MKAVNSTIVLVSFVYLSVSLFVIYMFGSAVNKVFFENLKRLNGKLTWEGLVVRIAYLIIVACHIPYIYFACKEAALIMVDEIQRKTIS